MIENWRLNFVYPVSDEDFRRFLSEIICLIFIFVLVFFCLPVKLKAFVLNENQMLFVCVFNFNFKSLKLI